MIGMIWAQAHGRAIGKDGAMPWHVPEDLAHFRTTTSASSGTSTPPVIMGRVTWESLSPRFRPLPGRRNIVITRQHDYAAPGAELAPSLESALSLAGVHLPGEDGSGDRTPTGSPPVWIMGGAQIYAAGMAFADTLVVTEFDIDVSGADAFAPAIDSSWEPVETDPAAGWHISTSGVPYRFVTYQRVHQRGNA